MEDMNFNLNDSIDSREVQGRNSSLFGALNL